MKLDKRPEIERFASALPPGVRAAVVHGRDRSGVREVADRIAARATARPDDPFDTASLADGDLDDSGRLLDELGALSLMGGRRLVRVRLSGDKVGPERAAVDALARHLAGEANPDAFLLVESGALDRNSALRKAAEAAPGAACLTLYEDEAGDVARLAREALAAEKIGLTGEALDLFVARLPKERGVARQEIERLILYVGPGRRGPVAPGELTDFFGVEPEASLGEVALDAFGGRAGGAYAGLRRAKAEGDGGPAVVRALAQHLARLRRAGILAGAGASPSSAAKQSGVFWKIEREFLRQLQAWRMAELDGVQLELVEADRACKQTGAPDALIAERLALTIAARARRLGL